MLALTFDDGPDPRGTPEVLDALWAVDVKATFFVLGERVEENLALLSRVRREGHAVEVHGHGHLRHPYTSRPGVEQDLDRALAVLGRVDITPAWWRIPWGHLADFTLEVAAERGLAVAGWTIDTHDWRGDAPANMLAGMRLERGGIVLAHDGVGSGARRTTARATADLVGPLVGKARDAGLEPGPLRHGWPVPVPVGNPEFHPGLVHAT